MQLHLQVACAEGEIPRRGEMKAWVTAALLAIGRNGGEVTVRVVGRAEMAALNRKYRNQTGPTNVLAFPFEAPSGLPPEAAGAALGDIVICAQLAAREAAAQGKPPMAHWAHLVVHGTLHLCGFDHQLEAEAARMEALENEIMAGLGIAPPGGR